MSTLLHDSMPAMAGRIGRLGVLMLLWGAAFAASAQWAWRDEHGRAVYSDQPPPPTVKLGDILQRPTASAPASSPEASDGAGQREPGSAPNQAAGASAANAGGSAPPKAPTMAEREQEFRKRLKERADAEKKLADAQAQDAQKAQDCERARGYLKSLEDGVRLLRTTADGNRELLDETQREAELQRTRDLIRSRCS